MNELIRYFLLCTGLVFGVSLSMLPDAWALQSPPTTLSFQAVQGGTNPPSQSVNVSKSNSHRATWTASDNATWLTVSPGTGTMMNTAPFAPAVNTTGLAAGTYTASSSVMIKVRDKHRLIPPST